MHILTFENTYHILPKPPIWKELRHASVQLFRHDLSSAVGLGQIVIFFAGVSKLLKSWSLFNQELDKASN